MGPLDIPTFATHQLTLLASELAAELSSTTLLTSSSSPAALARAGLAILNLHVASQRTGLGGKTVLELQLDPAIAGADARLPEHGLRVGDIVGVREQTGGAARKREKEDKGVDGVVVRCAGNAVAVALDKEEGDGDGLVLGGRLWMWVVMTMGLSAWMWADEKVVVSSWPTTLRTSGKFRGDACRAGMTDGHAGMAGDGHR